MGGLTTMLPWQQPTAPKEASLKRSLKVGAIIVANKDTRLLTVGKRMAERKAKATRVRNDSMENADTAKRRVTRKRTVG